jgi:hypothetical protein
MSDFNDYIKNAFKSDNDMQVPDQAWNEFIDYSKSRQKSPKGLMYWMVPALLAFLFLSNIFWWNYSESRIQNILTENITRDTVYITEIVTQELDANSILDLQESSLLKKNTGSNVQIVKVPVYTAIPRFTLPDFENTFGSLWLTSNRNPLKSDKLSNKNIDGQNPAIHSTNSMVESLSMLEGIGLSQSSFIHNRVVPGIPIYIRNQDYSDKSFLEKIRPKTFSLYGQSGVAFSSGLEIGSFSGIGSSLGFASSFSRRVRAVIGLGYQSLKFSTYEYLDPQVLEHINEPENMQLEKITARRQKLLINANLEYSIYTKGRLRPFLGVGLAYGSSTLKNVEYKFVGGGGTIEFYLPDFDAQKLVLLGPSIGTDINLFDKLDARINLNMQYRLSGIEHSGLYSLQTGLYWHF